MLCKRPLYSSFLMPVLGTRLLCPLGTDPIIDQIILLEWWEFPSEPCPKPE